MEAQNNRQADIDKQDLWDVFGKDCIIDFFHVDSRPNSEGKRKGIILLKRKIAEVAFNLKEMGRTIPKLWQDIRMEIKRFKNPYLSLDRVISICSKKGNE